MQTLNTSLIRNVINAAKPYLKEMSYPLTIAIPYSEGEMEKFFGVCVGEDEELEFKFFP